MDVNLTMCVSDALFLHTTLSPSDKDGFINEPQRLMLPITNDSLYIVFYTLMISQFPTSLSP